MQPASRRQSDAQRMRKGRCAQIGKIGRMHDGADGVHCNCSYSDAGSQINAASLPLRRLAIPPSRGENCQMRNNDILGFVRKSLLLARGAAAARHAALSATLLAAFPAATLAQGTHAASFPVGMRQLEYIDSHEGSRHLALTVFYPAVGSAA